MTNLRLPIGIALVVGGIILLIVGVSAADSFASDVSEFFTGQPTDKAVWMMIGGAAAVDAGAVLAGMSSRALKR